MGVWRFVVFFAVFFSIYFGMHYYVFRTVTLVISSSWFRWLFWAFAVSFPLVQIVGHASPLCPGPWVTRLTALWAGTVFQLFFYFLAARLFLLLWSRFPSLPMPSRAQWISAIVVLVALLSLWGMWRALGPSRIVRYTVDRSSFFGRGKTVRVVQLSDLHLGNALGESFFKKVVDNTLSLAPDLVLITGDLVDMDLRSLEGMLPLLRALRVPQGTYAVTGNHEYISNVNAFLETMKEAAIPVLQNRLLRSPSGIQIAGVNDPSARMAVPPDSCDFVRALADYRPDSPCILMAHQPSGYEFAVEKGVDLVLSGHTHSGQMFPFQLFVRAAFRHITGQHRVGPKTDLVVSNGTGFWGPPLRIVAPPQIVVVDFKF